MKASQAGSSPSVIHRRLSCGIELAVMPMPGRPVAAVEIRLFAGYAFELPAYLGVSHVLQEAITKGTARRDARALNDAFDEIGATHACFAGRETFGFSSMCLPEFLPQVIDLHAEMIRTPTLPEEACAVAVELSQQAISSLNDDPQELAKKMLSRQAYGEPLGRHVLGEPETLERIGRAQVLDHWQRLFSADRMLVSIAGAVDADAVADLLEARFEGFGAPAAQTDSSGLGATALPPERPRFPLQFAPVRAHVAKELEQEQVNLCFRGSALTDDDSYAERVAIGVLAGGMSGRLFTEIREKQGLVYWVGAWSDHPRGHGIVHLGASTTPERVDKTYTLLLREVDRLSDDLTEKETGRAIAGIVTRTRTRGDVTRSRAGEMVEDLFYHGRPIPTEEKLARVKAVTVSDVRDYLRRHPREQLSVLTVGPRELGI